MMLNSWFSTRAKDSPVIYAGKGREAILDETNLRYSLWLLQRKLFSCGQSFKKTASISMKSRLSTNSAILIQ